MSTFEPINKDYEDLQSPSSPTQKQHQYSSVPHGTYGSLGNNSSHRFQIAGHRLSGLRIREPTSSKNQIAGGADATGFGSSEKHHLTLPITAQDIPQPITACGTLAATAASISDASLGRMRCVCSSPNALNTHLCDSESNAATTGPQTSSPIPEICTGVPHVQKYHVGERNASYDWVRRGVGNRKHQHIRTSHPTSHMGNVRRARVSSLRKIFDGSSKQVSSASF